MASGLFDTPSSVKTLRRYWKGKNQFPDPEPLAIQLANETDRSFVILTATILDDALLNLISRNLSIKPTSTQLDYIFRYDGPFGSFSSRIEAAFLFGLIDEITRSQLSDLREMRNACAHSTQPMSFDTKELVAVAKRVFKSNFIPPSRIDSPRGVRHALMTEFLVLLQTMMYGSRQAGTESAAEIINKLVSDAGVPSPDKPTPDYHRHSARY